MSDERGQATVELALVLPAVLLVVLVVVQLGLVVRDRLALVHATRLAARAVIVEPTHAAALDAIERSGVALSALRVEVAGDRSPDGLAEVSVSARPSALPVLGRVLRLPRQQERLVVVVEGA